jgi:hypothetical protein
MFLIQGWDKLAMTPLQNSFRECFQFSDVLLITLALQQQFDECCQKN